MDTGDTLLEPLIENMEYVINKALQLDQKALNGLSQLNGKVFLITAPEINLELYVMPEDRGLQISLEEQDKIDVTIKGRPLALMGLVLNKDGGVSVLPKELEIKGDINLAQQLQTVLRELELDWEDYLSQWIGDTAAHKFGKLFRSTGKFLKQAGSNFSKDTSEYLRFRQKVLPDQHLIDGFVQAVDEMRNDVERLKQRIERLQKT